MDVTEARSADSEQRATQWFAASGQRLEWLADRFPLVSLNYSDASLRVVLADARGTFTLGERTADEDLPPWYRERSTIGYQQLATESLWLIDALAYYEGEVIITHDPMRLHWGIHDTRIAGGGWFSQPAVLGYRWPYCTIEDIALFALRAATGRPEEPQHVVAAINCFLSIGQVRPWVGLSESDAPNS